MSSSSQNQQPPMRASDEATEEQLQLAHQQGAALQRAIETMTREVAQGAAVRAGDYLIGYAVEHAEGMYVRRDGSLEWEEPQDENAHLEIVVRDAADGRFVPGLTVTATLLDSTGREVGTHHQPFLWHPWLYHYGRNWRVPGDGQYTLQVRVDVPDFPRHDKKNGHRYADPVQVSFSNVPISTGQKRS